MKKSKMLYFAVVLFAGLFALSGCPKRADVSAVPETQKIKPEAVSGAEEKPENKPGQAAGQMPEDAKERAAAGKGLKPIYFDFDRSLISDEAKTVMLANAEWLKANPEARIRIEGNCDDRGTKEYNLALGQRRAAGARKYLADLGISSGRISLISYGKEKPFCTDLTEECMQKNRRDDFVVVTE